MMPILVELMLNRGKPAMMGRGGSVTLDFPAQKCKSKCPVPNMKNFSKQREVTS
jgi:hypothetical protein